MSPHGILEFLIDNQLHLKTLCRDITIQYKQALTEEPFFSEEITEQYISTCNEIITDYVTKNLAINTEQCIILLEGLDLPNFLKGE
jgi:uncharacterized protein VirK/YbjX